MTIYILKGVPVFSNFQMKQRNIGAFLGKSTSKPSVPIGHHCSSKTYEAVLDVYLMHAIPILWNMGNYP